MYGCQLTFSDNIVCFAIEKEKGKCIHQIDIHAYTNF
jgi:hypothetical protein